MLDIQRFFRRLFTDRRANISVVAALAMPVLVGSLGIGAETASWYAGKRGLQIAADSAAIAAATNGTPEGYAVEARAVAAQYGLRQGVDGVQITASNAATCPNGNTNCFSVVIERAQPLLLAQVVGFGGDMTLNGAPAKRIMASAVAIQANTPREYCILALAGSGASQGIRTNGAPDADLTGCNVMSNTDAQCNGHSLKADVADAHGVSDGCAVRQNSNVGALFDPYSGLKANIPADKCGGDYYTAPNKKNDPPFPSNNMLLGIEDRAVIDVCGDMKLNGPVFIQSSAPGTVLIIRNGQLDMNGYSIETKFDSSLTIVFTGTDNSRTHGFVGGGSLDFKAPTTGVWKGMAIYQDPRTTGGVDLTFAGNSPTWAITGMVYAPHASVTFSGAVNKASNGLSCFGMVVDNLRVNGTAQIINHGECHQAGLTLPYSQMPGRGQLVS
ncbi:MAG: hypothetical protein JF588_14070 [Caulobacterales bacterium]|nr:hypothetical protein [Caulobacterales bacterium]